MQKKKTGTSVRKTGQDKTARAKTAATKTTVSKAAVSKTAVTKTAVAKAAVTKTATARSPAGKTATQKTAGKAAGLPSPISLREGDAAPAFSGRDQDGKQVSLQGFKGRKLVLYFYPEDDTPTCTVQACNLRDNYSLLKKEGFEVVGVSPDDEKKHKKFEAKYDLPFTLIADPEHAIIDQYGVWGEKQLYGRRYMGIHRTTFLIDEKGVIRRIFLRPRNKAHAEEIVKAWKELEG